MIEITVRGLPGPQGSKSFKGLSKAGHAILIESSKKVKPWRQAVGSACVEVSAKHGGALTIKGAVSVEMIFTLPKPKSAPKKRMTWPDRQPDLSKLVRSTEDALTEAGVWEDDARVIETHSAKRFPGEGVDALSHPGAVIRIRRVFQ